MSPEQKPSGRFNKGLRKVQAAQAKARSLAIRDYAVRVRAAVDALEQGSDEGTLMLADYARLRITRHPVWPYHPRMWELRHNLGAYDAAYIEVGQLDVFRDEAIRYALTLSQAGVPAELHLHPGVPHEYDAIAFDADVSRRAQGDRDRVLRSL